LGYLIPSIKLEEDKKAKPIYLPLSHVCSPSLPFSFLSSFPSYLLLPFFSPFSSHTHSDTHGTERERDYEIERERDADQDREREHERERCSCLKKKREEKKEEEVKWVLAK
jgi:hypothetical protein